MDARAGSSKSTSILNGITYAPEHKVLLAAFNKHIATELQHKLDHPGAVAKTLHAHGLGFVKANWPGVKIDVEDADAYFIKLAEKYHGTIPGPLHRLVCRAFTQTREVEPFADTSMQVVDVMDEFGIWPDEHYESNGYSMGEIAHIVLTLLTKAKAKRPFIDFADMVWLPIINNWVKPAYSLVVIDEAQDMNPGQIELAIRSSKNRVAVVGDIFQCIYQFRGADANTIGKLQTRLSAQTLPLTVSFRCPKKVVQEAKVLVPDFEEWEGAKEGSIHTIPWKQLNSTVGPKDFVLSRTNAVLSKAAFGMLKAGISVQILGKDIGARIIKVIQARKAKDIVDLMSKIKAWSNEEQAKAIAANRKAKAAAIQDQADTIIALAEECKTIPQLIATIENLFDDDKKDPVICSTVHKAKGLEANNVFILMESFAWLKKITANDPEEAQAERNIEYVAITRSKDKLYRVTGKSSDI